MITRDQLAELDADDVLAPMRGRFHLPEGVIYLDGNSLGPMPKATAARVAEVVRQEWGEGLIRSWNDAGWMDMPFRIGAKIARLIGAPEGNVSEQRACFSTLAIQRSWANTIARSRRASVWWRASSSTSRVSFAAR